MSLHMATKHKRLEPNHLGEVLLEDFMKPLSVSSNRLARDTVVPPERISAIVNGKRDMNPTNVAKRHLNYASRVTCV